MGKSLKQKPTPPETGTTVSGQLALKIHTVRRFHGKLFMSRFSFSKTPYIIPLILTTETSNEIE